MTSRLQVLLVPDQSSPGACRRHPLVMEEVSHRPSGASGFSLLPDLFTKPRLPLLWFYSRR
jgi:hypothetical protein